MPFWLNIDPDLHVYHHALDAPFALLLISTMVIAGWHFRTSRPWISFALIWVSYNFV